MKITQNNHSDLHATLNILIEPADYQNFVQNALKKIASKQSFPGFRAGKAPIHLVEQKYGDYVRMEEVEKLVNKSINEHLQTNELELVARIKEVEPIETVTEKGHYAFAYELAFAPKLNINIENEQFNYYKIANEQEDIERFIRSLQFGQASQEEATEVSEKTYIFNKVLTQDEQGEWKVTLQAKFHITEITKDSQGLFIGKKMNDKIQINPHNLVQNKADLAIMFQLTKSETEQLPTLVEFEIQALKNLEIPPINAAFLEKETGVLVEEEKVAGQLRAYVIEKIQQLQQPKLDEVFYDFAIHQLKQDHPVALPEDFLKAQLLSNPELTPEMVEKEFPAFLKQIRTNVLERFLVKQGNLTLKAEDIKAVMKAQLETRLDPNMLAQLAAILDQIVDQQYQQLVKAESKEDQNRFAELQEIAIQYQIIAYLKNKAQIVEQEISQEQLNNKLEELRKSYQN